MNQYILFLSCGAPNRILLTTIEKVEILMYYMYVKLLKEGNKVRINTLFKYIFIIFVIGIILYAAYKIYNNSDEIDNQIIEIEEAENVVIKDIRIAISNYDTINPLITNNREALNVGTLIFEPLFTLTSDYQLEPCLATEWSKTNENTYVIKIDTSIKWHDGAYLTAKDVKFTVDRLKEGNSVYKSNVEHVIALEIVDASTVKITSCSS